MSEEQSVFITRNPILLVWLLTGLGCVAGIIMAVILWMSIVEIRQVREDHFALKGRLSSVLSSLEQETAERKLYYTQLLEGTQNLPVSKSRQTVLSLVSLVKTYNKEFGNPGLEEIFSLLEERAASLEQLQGECMGWAFHNMENSEKLPQAYRDVVAGVREIQEAVDRSYGRQRLARAVRIQRFDALTGPQATELGRQIIGQEDTPALLSILLRDVADLTLLVERLNGEENVDYLADLKDNLLRTALVRLRRSVTLLNDEVKDLRATLPGLLDNFEISLFGQEYAMDNNHQRVAVGKDGYYGYLARRLELQQNLEQLRRRIINRFDRFHETLLSARGKVDAKIDQKGEEAEQTLSRTWITVLLIILVSGLVFLLLASMIISQIKRQLRIIEESNLVLDARTKALLASQQELNESKLRLQSLSGNLLNAQENERRRIARELHDELGAAMAFLKLQVRNVEKCLGSDVPHVLGDECDKVREHINEVIQNVRRLSRDLSPAALEDLGIEAAVEQMVENFAELHHIEMKTELAALNHHLVNEEAQRNIYRVLQELLTNIGRHSKAKHASILVERRECRLHFLIQDDGVGFDLHGGKKENKKQGMGLTTITERIRMLDGTMEIESAPGKGFTVIISTPIC